MFNRMFFVFSLLSSAAATAESFSVTCGAMNGYSHYLAGGYVPAKSSGFAEDAISGGKFTLNISEEGDGDVLALDASRTLKSAKAQGGTVLVTPAGTGGLNWIILYKDGTVEVYGLHFASDTLTHYRNTVGNENVAKTSLMTASCG